MSALAEQRPRGPDKRRRVAVGLNLGCSDAQAFLVRFDGRREVNGQNVAGDYARRCVLVGDASMSSLLPGLEDLGRRMSALAEQRPRGAAKRRRLAVGLKLAYPDDRAFLARFDHLREAHGQNSAGEYACRCLFLGSTILSGQPIERALLDELSATGYNNGSNTHSNTSGVGSDNESRYDPPPETESGPGNSEVGGERGVTRTQLLRGLQQQPHTPRHEG